MRLSVRASSLVATMAALSLLASAQAFAQIAPGVTQSAAHTANITGTITSSTGAPVAGANIKLTGPSVFSTKSDTGGTFRFTSVPWGTYEIIVASSLGIASRSGIVLNGDVNVAIQYQAPSALQTIAHVSTTSAGAHINVTSSAITSVSPSEYAFEGNASWKQLFAQVPGVAPSGYNDGGTAYIEALAGSPQAPVVLSLNGALPYETSTTIDGMPLQNTSYTNSILYTGGGVDLSNVPMNAFGSADVVRGPGANAPSIVDSIGGSFVLHAPGRVSSNNFEFATSNDPWGGIVSNARLALHLGNLSATLIYGINDSPGPLATRNVLGGVVSTPATIGGEEVWGPYISYPNPPGYRNCYCQVSTPLLYSSVLASSEWSEHTGGIDLSYDFTPSITAEVFYAGDSSSQPLVGGYYPTEFAPSGGVPAYSGSYAVSPPGQPTYALLGATAEQPPSIESSSLLEEKITAYLAGGALRLAALQDTSYQYQEGNDTYPDGAYRVWGTEDVGAAYPGTPTSFDGTIENLTFSPTLLDIHNKSVDRDYLASYAVQLGSSSSAGVSYVSSYYDNPASQDDDFSGFIYTASQPAAISESTSELRVHFDSEVSDTLSLGLSWYFANGSYHVPSLSNANLLRTLNFPYDAPRFGAVWEASPNIAVRAAVGGGYALPTLYDLIGVPLSYNGFNYAQTLANPNLKPEESFGTDIGSDVRLRDDTVLSGDIYWTNLYGQFFTSDTLSTLNGRPYDLTNFGNIATSRMEGINVTVHRSPFSGYYWDGTLGLTRGYVVSLPAGFYNNPAVPCTSCVNTTIIPGLNFTAPPFGATVPYASASGQLGYRWVTDRYFDLTATYYGHNNIYNTPHAFVELDAHAGYAITPNVRLLATFRNITGVYDESIMTVTPGYSYPTIPNGPEYFIGAAEIMPYGPRAVIVTADFRYH